MVREFRERGYLREALLNFIALLGWAYDDKTEFFTMEELTKSFDIHRVNKSSAVFSYEKLDWFNGMYIRQKKTGELYTLLLPYLAKAGFIKSERDERSRDYILRIIPLIQERMTTLREISDLIWFFFDEHYEIRDPEQLIPKKGSRQDGISILKKTGARLKSLSSFEEKGLEEEMRKLVDETGLKPGQIFMTIRVAVTGSRVSPGLFETMSVLGKKRVLSRLENAAEIIEKM
jgi:glutamyl-tRNA synthetase